MPTIAESTLASWTKPAFDNEDDKREYTERTIREAIKGHPELAKLPVNVYAKGSYRNNTNVRRDSDVDVAVELTSIYIPEYGDGVTPQSIGFEPYSGSYDTSDFKDHVGQALVGAFGSRAVQRHNKVFEVRESARNLAADVVPCFTYRWFYAPGRYRYEEGIQLIADRGFAPHNFPQQHYDNGCTKNNWRDPVVRSTDCGSRWVEDRTVGGPPDGSRRRVGEPGGRAAAPARSVRRRGAPRPPVTLLALRSSQRRTSPGCAGRARSALGGC